MDHIPIADKAQLDADGTLVAFKDDLEKNGQRVTATVAGALGANAGAAKQQFTFLTKQNVRYRKADTVALQAKSRAERF